MATNYLLLYSGGGMPTTEAETQAVMKQWEIWFGQLGMNLVDGGNPFTQTTKTIDSSGKVGDGVSVMASGYSVIKANSMDEAVKLAQSCPVLKSGARISVFETINAMGM